MSDPQLAPKHAQIVHDAGRFWIADLTASAGTLVNGTPVYRLDLAQSRRPHPTGTIQEQNSVSLVDIVSGKPLGSADGFYPYPFDISVNRDRSLLAFSSGAHTFDKVFLGLWDLLAGEFIGYFEGSGTGSLKTIDHVDFHPDGTTLVTSEREQSHLILWDPASLSRIGTFDLDREASSFGFSPDGTLLGTGGMGKATIWHLASREEVDSIGGFSWEIGDLAFNPDNALIALYSSGVTALWDFAAETDRQTHFISSSDIDLSPDGSILAFDNGDTIELWDTTEGQQLRVLRGHVGEVDKFGFSPEGRLIASTAEDDTIRLWDVASGELLHTIEDHARSLNNVLFTTDGMLLITSSMEGIIRVWGLGVPAN